MVLAKSLRQAGVRHDLVLLHTSDMPKAAVDLMARAGWVAQDVEEVLGVRALYNHGEPRFERVFTKLQALGLTNYEKVLLLDIDTLALQNLDELFDLPAPAAMARGPKHGYQHGDLIDGRYFFGGASYVRSWGQRSGINAGVMLLAPDTEDLKQMLQEVSDSQHPSHIKGNGPEQDYLSRYWASSWTHIGVEYNFQLHQLFYVLHPDYVRNGERAQFLQGPPGQGIRLMHYSGPLKPWSRFLDPQWAWSAGAEGDAQFLRAMLESFPGYWLWVLRDPETWSSYAEKEGLALDSSGCLRRIDWQRYYDNKADWWSTEAPCGSGPKAWWPLGEAVEIPEAAVRGAQALVEDSLIRWRRAYAALSAELGLGELVGPASLAGQLEAACTLPAANANGGSPAVAATEAQEPTGSSGADSASATGWSCCDGWWVEKPVVAKATAVAGCVPERFVTFSVRCQVMLDVRGGLAAGVHAIAVIDGGAADRLSDGDISAWMERVPEGALVLVAFVELAPLALAEALAAFAGAGCGVPSAAAPADCCVMVALGQKGVSRWSRTMAAADFAIATAPILA